jgi:ABC-2 type transport system ATP-binding protein
MRQRLGLAQAMLHDPDLLILDEPTDGLDPMGRSQIRDVLDKLKQRGKTVFLNSHILQEVELICDRVAIMALGQLRGIGTIDELIRSHTNDQSGSVKLEVLAIPSQIRQIESLPANTMIESIDLGRLGQDGLSRIAVDNIDQAGVDSLVDQLRSAQISILRIERARPSLEQVFMNIVGAAKP